MSPSEHPDAGRPVERTVRSKRAADPRGGFGDPGRGGVGPDLLDGPSERRGSVRVPLDRPIRIGPPGGLPYATVSARDLSAGGLFIDAERSVRVGARFSVEVNLEDGDRVYVSEAEVTDNRTLDRGTGFGARFVSLSDEARRLLESEVASLAQVTLREGMGSDAGLFDTLDVPTLDGSEGPGFGSSIPLPSDIERSRRAMASVLPDDEAQANVPTLLVRVRTRWSTMKAHLRSLPILSTTLYGVAAVALGAAAVFVLRLGAGTSSAPTEEGRRVVTSEMHEQVTGAAGPLGVEERVALAPEDVEVVNPLPEAQEASAPPPAEPTHDRAPPARRGDERRGDPLAVRSKKDERTAALGIGGPEPSASARSARSAGIIRIPVGPEASLRKQFVLHSPERFVVDLRGSKLAEAPQVVGSSVRRVRLGRHDGFTRLVFDTRGPIDEARAEVRGDHLRIRLRLR